MLPEGYNSSSWWFFTTGVEELIPIQLTDMVLAGRARMS